ncbi:phosphoribosyl transferase [Candidatus Daviesbacteria bacterium]|nr:phosphoribosyl transferase [Candidatus Daviesbacteria bacterium]
MYFKDRVDAGKRLAGLLGQFKGKGSVIYALPRGGVVIGAEIAKALGAPLDLIITRKIGHPNQPELAIAALSEDGHLIIDPDFENLTHTSWFLEAVEKEKAEAKRRREVYLGGRKPISCLGKIAILVDDGIATGLTLKAAIQSLKYLYRPKKIVVAVPLAPLDIIRDLEKKEQVEVITVEVPKRPFGAIGMYYQNFSEVSDEEVVNLLNFS